MRKPSVTILILTYERPRYLARTLSFLRGKGLAVIVADGSNLSFDIGKLGSLGPHFCYFHMPRIDYISRLKYISEKVKTGFIIMLQDDGFLNTSGLNVAVNHLKLNPKLSGVIGKELSFRGEMDDVRYWLDSREGASDTIFYEGDLISRVSAYFRLWYPRLLYSCLRVENFRRAVSILPNRNAYSIDFELLLEPHIELSMLIQGEVKKIPEVITYRSFENPSVRTLNDPRVKMGKLSSGQWLSGPEFTTEVSSYISLFLTVLPTKHLNYSHFCNQVLLAWANERGTKTDEDNTFIFGWLSKIYRLSNLSRWGFLRFTRLPTLAKKIIHKIMNREVFLATWHEDECIYRLNSFGTRNNVAEVSDHFRKFL
jgi:glycosyltransferase domain-containing protein